MNNDLSDCDQALIKRIQLSTGQIGLKAVFEKIHSVTPIFESVKLAAIFTQNYVAFCKNIPSFKALSKNDKFILIKFSYAEMCAIWNAFLYDENINDGTQMIFTVLMKNAISNDTKIRDLLIIQLLFRNRPNIQSPEFVHHSQLIYVSLLKRYLKYKFADPVKAKFHYRLIANLLNGIGAVSEAIDELLENNKVNPSEI